MADIDPKVELLATFKSDRPTAHRVLFAHRHGNIEPAFHEDLITDWGSDEPEILQMVFRGGAKSTLAEEGLLLGACFREFKYAVIFGYSWDKACQRLHSIRYEAENNPALAKLFGPLQGAVWDVDHLLFANGVMIQAMGKGQSLRGMKHLDMRPDYLLGDDLEDKPDVRNSETMRETYRWFTFDLIPALAQGEYRARVLATPLHPDALPMQIAKEGTWKVRRVPIYYPDETGKRVSAWPDRFPLTRQDVVDLRAKEIAATGSSKRRTQDSIEHIEERAARAGHTKDFQCEYLVTATSSAEKPFKREMIRIVPQYRQWQPVNVMFDPARTINKESARTGFAAWSWIGVKFIVWEAWGKFLKPDEIIEAIFQAGGCEPSTGYERMCGPYDVLVHLGVETDGLEDWLWQPVRAEMARRGVILPIRPMRAPRGKIDFIRALQAYYNAREVEHAQELPDLDAELLSFPHGTRLDVPNALAYALLMRRGRPIFSDFSSRNIEENIRPSRDHPAFLAMNATRAVTTGILVQWIDGALRIFDDWVREGDPSESAPLILMDAKLAFGTTGTLHVIAPPLHFERYQNVGLRQAIKPDVLERGADPDKHAEGRSMIRDLLQREIRGLPGILIAANAKWTAAAFSGGYTHVELKHGALAEYAEEGTYRTLMEGLESLVGMAAKRSTSPQEGHSFNATTPAGVPYRSMVGAGAGGRTMRRG